MGQLAVGIRDNLETLADEYGRRLRAIPDYDRLPDQAIARIARDDLRLIVHCLETEDRTEFLASLREKALERLDQGFTVGSMQHALTALEETLCPSVTSLKAATFLWRTLSEARNIPFEQSRDALRRSERGLRESRQLLQLIMDNIPQSIFWKNRDLVYLGCNREFARDAGLPTPEDVVGKSDFDMPWLEQADLYRGDDSAVMDSGIPKLGYEEPQTTPDGGQIWLRTSKVPVRDAEGQVVAILGMYEDISERKQAEMALHESEDRFRTMAESIQDGLTIIEDGVVVFVNDRLSEILGYSRDELMGMSSLDFAAPEEKERLGQMMYQARQQGESLQDLSFWAIRKDGSRRYLRNQYSLSRQEGGITGRFVVTSDLTEQKLVEESLAQQQAFLRQIIDLNPSLIFVKDREGRYVLDNQAHAAIYGRTVDEVIGRTDFDIVSDPTVAERFRREDLDVMDSLKVKTHPELPLIDAAGNLHWLQSIQRPVVDKDGIARHVLGVSTDITKRKQLEQQIQELVERRGQQVHTATEVAQEIAAAPALQDLYQRVVTLVKERLSYYHVQIFRYEPAVGAVMLVAGYGEPGRALLAAGHRLPMGRGVVGTAAASRHAVLASDVAQDADWVPNPHLPDTKGELAVPIVLRDQMLGILDVQSDTAGALTTDDQVLLEGLCGQIAIAIESTRLRQEMEESLRELENLYRAASRAGWERLRREGGATGYRFDRVETTRADDFWLPELDLAVDEGAVVLPSADDTQTVVAPLAVRGEVLGVLGVQTDPELPLSDDDLALLESVSEQVAQALESARLFDEQQRARALLSIRVNELDCLNDIGRKIDETPPIADLLDWLVQRLPAAMQYPDWCRVAVDFEGTVYGAEEAKGLPRQMVHGLQIGGQQVGQVFIAYVEDREFLDEESALLGDVARRISGYIENRRLFQQTQDALIDTQLSQAALREVMELQTAIVENADYALISTTPEGTIMTFNRAAEQMLGYRAEDLIGEATPGVFHDPEEVVARAAIFSEDLGYTIEPGFEVFVARARYNLPNRYEWTYIRKDGSRLPVLLAVSALRDTQDNITGFLGIAQDITARRAAEAERERLLVELQQSQEFLSSLLDNVPNPIFVKNVQGVYIECNQAFLDYLGSAREEIIGKSVYDLQTDKSLADRYNEMDMVLFRSPGQQIYESRVKYADGTFHDVIFNKATFSNPDGSVGGLIGTIVDISDRKRAEAQRERLLAQTETLYSVSLDLIAAGNPHEMLQAIATPALAAGANTATLMYIDTDAENRPEWAEVIAVVGTAPTPVGMRLYLPESPDADLLLADPDHPLLIDDLGNPHEKVDAQIAQMIRATGTLALVVIPLRVGQRWEGVVTLSWPAPHDFDPEEEQLYNVAGPQLAIAVQGLRLRQQVEHRAVWLQTSAEVSRAASTILNPDMLMRRSVELVRERFDLYYAGLFLVDDKGQNGNGAGDGEGWAVLRVGTGEAGRRMVQQGHRLKIGGESMIGQCLATMQSRVAMDVGKEAIRFDNPLLPDTRTELALPLVSRGQPMGALTIQSERPAAFTAEDIAVLQTMADQLATTIDNAHLIEQSSRRAERERLTRTITDRVRRGTDREAIMRVALEDLSAMLGASTSVVRLGTRDQLLSTDQLGSHERKETED